MKNTKIGYFMEPQNFSVNDGEGIRTIIFFAGCPLRCQWCSNPESFTNLSKIAYYEESCTRCGKCTEVCPLGIGINLNTSWGRKVCNSCGLCIKACLTNNRKNLIYQYTSEEIIKMIESQKIFYRFSGGGVTFSGGEPTQQMNMLKELTNKLYDKAIDLAIETSGYFDLHEVKDILEKMDLIFIDIKHMDDKKHRLFTGVSNGRILKNIKGINKLKVPVVVRIPVIEGVNSSIENITKTAMYVKENIDVPKIELLPYHSLGNIKYEALGLEKPEKSYQTPSSEDLKELWKIIECEGVELVSYK